jgi:Tol biopolymer transport system component
MFTVIKGRYVILLGVFILLSPFLYSCASFIEQTPNITHSINTSQSMQTENKPTTLKGNKSVCENRTGAKLFEKLPPIDPTGKIAYAAEGIYLVNPEDNAIEAVYPVDGLNNSGRFTNLAWSPEGTMLSVVHKWIGEQVYSLDVVDFTNGQVCSLIEARGELSEPAWSPDNKNISVADRESGELINIEISTMNVSIVENSVYSSPQWIDNSHVSYLFWNSDRELSSLLSLDIITREKFEYIKESRLGSFLFSPNGINLAYSIWDQYNMNITNINNGITKTVEAYVPFDWTTDARILLAETVGRSMVLITLSSEISIRPLRIGGVCTQQAFSGDDSMVVITKIRNVSTFVIINLITNERKELFFPYCCPQYPVWNPKIIS